jgi:hypothetical protein
MSAHLAGTSVTRDRALDTCEPSCVPGAARPFFIHVVHSPLGAMGYMAAPELSYRGGEAGDMWQHRLLRMITTHGECVQPLQSVKLL